MSQVANVMHVPVFEEHASSSANYEEIATLRNQISTMDPQKRAANLLLRMADVARKVCVTAGKDVIGNVEGVAQILRELRE